MCLAAWDNASAAPGRWPSYRHGRDSGVCCGEERTELGVGKGQLALDGRLLGAALLHGCFSCGGVGGHSRRGRWLLRALARSHQADGFAPCAVPCSVHPHTARPHLQSTQDPCIQSPHVPIVQALQGEPHAPGNLLHCSERMEPRPIAVCYLWQKQRCQRHYSRAGMRVVAHLVERARVQVGEGALAHSAGHCLSTAAAAGGLLAGVHLMAGRLRMRRRGLRQLPPHQ